jgi:hypothetical protein
MFGAIQPEVLVSLGINSLVLVWLIVANARGVFVWKNTHLRELGALEDRVAQAITDRDRDVVAIRDEMNTRMDNFRADHATRVDQARADHEKQLAALVAVADGIRNDRDALLVAKQRDADDWRGAYHIAAENAKRSEDRMDEVLETVRLIYAAMNAIRTIAAGRDPELPPGSP